MDRDALRPGQGGWICGYHHGHYVINKETSSHQSQTQTQTYLFRLPTKEITQTQTYLFRLPTKEIGKHFNGAKL